ncbi:signal recognition particle, SRP9/SRP14 subunit [Trametes coccinea BRFM310]|uniref:Signal recognition particle subunit SRP14 n=1 Tax=Trametes coccinea (strain BRFM310) TaxID=1353009 RepID=A0A1Y2II96_TRAC3|nr:signal recognition particle, SRP9/SRP14 subunit [Trametes coccinea BRFM310]
MQLVDNETFYKQLSALFEASEKSGSIWLTHKRLTYEGGDVHMSSEDDTKEYPCLIRVTDGKEAKFSTVVHPAELDKFHAAYGALLKASMTKLRKRDKKREKQRAEEAARKKRRLQEEIVVSGPKRGNGRRKRQRKIKAALKLEEAKKKAQEREEAKARAKAS